MSDHEHQRLSAYLDDVLAPGERTQVAVHLEACAECTARLAELAAVDSAVASLPYQAPPGYFDTLPERVRARLGPKAAARRLPVWTWAAAAALLLAVVTPLTLLRRPDQRSEFAAREIPAAPPTLAAPQASSEAAPAETPRDGPKAETQPRPPLRASPVPKKRESPFATAPPEFDAGEVRQEAAPAAPAGMAPQSASASASAPAPMPPAEPEVAGRADESAAMGAGAGVSERRNQAKAAGARRAAPESSSGAAPESAPEEARLARDRFAGGVGGAAAAPKLLDAEAEWRRLDTARPHTPAEWRRLREDWRRFVARDPAGLQADEARVRIIEAGREAWRASSDPADEASFRKDAADYLDRHDALQKERVRELVR